MTQKGKKSPGPAGEVLKIEEPDWEQAVKKALAKKRPTSGWPERPVKHRERKKRRG